MIQKFSNELVEDVWQKGLVVIGSDPKIIRKDVCGAKIFRSKYGDRDSSFGWEIDHIKAVANDGPDDISNLRPLQWKNNASKQDGKLVCVVKG